MAIGSWLWETYSCALSCYIGQVCALTDWQEECELLEQTDLLVGEIGEMVGYVNFSSFSTFFKNKTGMTPVAWRKEHEEC